LNRFSRDDILSATLPSHGRRAIVKWETPVAIEWRFGFEITSYAAYR